MMQIVLIGLGAAAAAALLFASVASGSLFSILLFYLAPLPILIAALGWSHWAALIAASAAATGLAVIFGGYFFVAFLLGVGLPAWWLGYLALLGRPIGNGTGEIEWYPPGRLVLWSAILGALIVIVAIPSFGLDEASFRAGLRTAFERILRDRATPEDLSRLIEFLITVVPPGAAALATVTNVITLARRANRKDFRPFAEALAGSLTIQFPPSAPCCSPARLPAPSCPACSAQYAAFSPHHS